MEQESMKGLGGDGAGWVGRTLVALLMVVGVVGTILTGVVMDAGPAAATTKPGVNATSHNQGGEWWSTDGCSVVPDSGWHRSARFGWGYYSFQHACVHHDGCYRNRWASRATCDQWFLNDMRASCASLLTNQASCRERAWLYYLGVRYFGDGAYSRRSVSTPMSAYV